MRLLHSLKSTQWVMWSSPILLLVLVFTLSASTGSPRARASSTHAVTTSSTSTVASTTLTTTPPTTPVTTSAATPTTPTTSPSTNRVTTLSTNGQRAVNSSSATASNVGFVASAPAESASNGALRGTITPAEGLAAVPLAGPATWTLTASATVASSLECGGATVVVTSPFVVGGGEDCQLTLVPNQPSSSVTWELTPSS